MPTSTCRSIIAIPLQKRSSRKAYNRRIEPTMTTSPFDAYDLMSRSILSSIMGLKRKPRPQQIIDHNSSSGPSCSSAPVHSALHQDEEERTPHDIYREIVVECEQIERSGTSSPISDFESTLTSPCPVASPSPLVHPTFPIPMGPFMSEHGTYPQDQLAVCMPPPPYSVVPPPTEQLPFFATSPLLPHVEHPALLSQPIKREEPLNAISIEEIVQMVVKAMQMKSTGLAEERESPEEILRRKRQQNNQAAARYRKRQREARDMAEGELDLLLRRNESLRRTIENMQLEIEELKKAVLSAGRS
ncbi:unnamed protein product [Cylicocyclus nassatus]|uniref:BZIP domain-containing protein n=1 Tax=Cylicocyclus nassatus TaxID=53992 RepID=A0AA36M930_CYLNA|nr:unnamed protein product [Cylicocyclus nassatus]